MDMEITPEQIRRDEERDRLFALTQDELYKLSYAEQYQRMRYEREIEGYAYVGLLRQGLIPKEAAIKAKKMADELVSKWRHRNVKLLNKECST